MRGSGLLVLLRGFLKRIRNKIPTYIALKRRKTMNWKLLFELIAMKINPQRISKHRSYTIKEICVLLCLDEKTCFRWIEAGLKTIDGCKKPILISGESLKEFIKNRRLKKKIKVSRYQFLCMTCKAASYAKRGSIKYVGDKKTALCRVCNGKMSRIIKPSH